MTTPTLMKNKLDDLYIKQQKLSRSKYKEKIRKEFFEKDKILIANSSKLFPPNLKELGKLFFGTEKIPQDNLFRYSWKVVLFK